MLKTSHMHKRFKAPLGLLHLKPMGRLPQPDESQTSHPRNTQPQKVLFPLLFGSNDDIRCHKP